MLGHESPAKPAPEAEVKPERLTRTSSGNERATRALNARLSARQRERRARTKQIAVSKGRGVPSYAERTQGVCG